MREDFSKRLSKYFIILVVMIIVFFALISLQTSIPIMPNGNEWIGFYGSLLGGILTLLGVSETIRFTHSQYNETERLKILPFVSLSYTNIENYIVSPLVSKEEYLLAFKGGEHLVIGEMPVWINCCIKNIGLGSATNIRMEVEVIDTDESLEKSIYASRFSAKRTLTVNEESEEFKLAMDFENILGCFISVWFSDIMGNNYCQKILVSPADHLTKSGKSLNIFSLAPEQKFLTERGFE